MFRRTTASDHFNRATSLGHKNRKSKIFCAAAGSCSKIKMAMGLLSSDLIEKLLALAQRKCLWLDLSCRQEESHIFLSARISLTRTLESVWSVTLLGFWNPLFLRFGRALGSEKELWNHSRVVLHKTLSARRATARFLMPLLFLEHPVRFGLGSGYYGIRNASAIFLP